MPSSEDCIAARSEVQQWAVEAVMKWVPCEKDKAEDLVSTMTYEQQIEWAEKIHGKIYRGAYSPY